MAFHKPDLRLFFAVWPEPHTLDVLAENAWLMGECSHGKPVPRSNLHMTLLFLGEQPRERVADIINAANRVKAHGFQVVCDKLRYMHDQHLIWTGVSAPDPALGRLRDSLVQEMDRAEVSFDRKRFKPHITLVRKALEAPKSIDFHPCRWTVERFSLVVSNLGPEGPRYHTLRDWALLPPKPAASEKIIKLSPSAAF